MKRTLICACLSILATSVWLALPNVASAQNTGAAAASAATPAGELPPPLAVGPEVNPEGQVSTTRPLPRSSYGSSAAGTAMIQPDPQTGNLVVIADEETLNQMAKVIEGLDKPVPQVLVKVLFLEVTHTNSLDLAAEVGIVHKSDGGMTTNLGQTGFGLGLSDALTAAALPLGATTPAAHTALANGGYYQFSNDDLQLTLRALANSTKLDVLSRPTILVRNNQTANVTVGQQIPMITNSRVDTSGNTVNTIQYTNVGIILDVTPRITTGKMVEMNVAPQISALTAQTVPVSAGTNTVSAPVIDMRSATTTVIAESGKTVVIGGMMQDNNTSSIDKVPILGDIPLLGALFRHTVTNKAKTELLIFLTPFIVESPQELQDVSMSESAKAEMSRTAFTPDEIDRYVDNLKEWPEKPLPDRDQPTTSGLTVYSAPGIQMNPALSNLKPASGRRSSAKRPANRPSVGAQLFGQPLENQPPASDQTAPAQPPAGPPSEE